MDNSICSENSGAAEATSEQISYKSERKMKAAPPVLSLLIILLSHLGWTNGLCNLENGTVARCHDLGDVKYIETYDLESLKTSVAEKVLSPGLFSNLSSLRHLDLSGGELERIEPGSFLKLVNLRSLDLADNRIEYLELASLDGLNHLRSLNLRRNNLRQLPPALARLKILRHLDVMGNPLQCNCATLRVRDLIAKRGVKMSKKILCAGPNNMKGTPLLKPDAAIICAFEDQDREMQRDQAYEGSGAEGSGDDPLAEFNDDNDNDDEEYVEVSGMSTEPTKELEIETPFPEHSHVTSVAPSTTLVTKDAETSSVEVTTSATSISDSLEKTTEEEEPIFFDVDNKKEQILTDEPTTEKKQEHKDLLFYPMEGSGDEEEGSGEGSGAGMIFTQLSNADDDTDHKDEKPSNASDESFFDILLSVLWSTAAPDEKTEPDLVDEQFIDVSSTKETVHEGIVPKKINLDEAVPSTTATPVNVELFSPTTEFVVIDSSGIQDSSKLGNVKADDDTINDELAEVSPARQSRKGVGSYVVLASLLAILATLIGFAVYKGDFCRKKRKRGDVENGTEMKDMQKALLDTGNAAHPKISSNGNAENMPLVEGNGDQEETKDTNEHQTSVDIPKSPNGTSDYTDPVKPPRRAVSSQDDQKTDEKPQESSSPVKDEPLSGRTSSIDPAVPSLSTNNGPTTHPSEPNGPPLSPGAQRVKITLQENPDSVPRTPILITRTMGGENLVKTP